MKYNENAGVLTEKRRELLDQILGHVTIEYTNKAAHEVLKEKVPVLLNGKHADFEPFEKNYDYEVVSCGKDTLKIKSTNKASGKTEVEIFTFESADIFWASSQSMPETREYYVRKQN